MRTHLYFILLIFFSIPHILFPQQNTAFPQITLEPLPISETFTSKNTHRIFQDNDGYMWFGTENKIYRYDGYDLKNYDTDIIQSGQLANNMVLAFTESNDTIFVGTEQGVLLIDKMKYEIKVWNHPAVENKRIDYITRDSKNNIWIGTPSHGLFKYNLDNKKMTQYTYIYNDPTSLPSNGITHVYEDCNSNIWITSWDQGLCRYVPESDNFEHYPPIPGRNNPIRLFQDKDKNLWITTWGAGVFRFNPSEKDLDKMYEKFEIWKDSRQAEETIFFGIEQDNVYGYIWLISYRGIFAITDIENKKYIELSGASSVGSPNNLFNEITKDKNGNFWIGSYGSTVYTVNFHKPAIINYDLRQTKNTFEAVPSVSAIYQDNSGIFWLGLVRMGMHFYDAEKREFVKLSYNKEVNDIFSQQININYIKEIKSTGEIWITFENSYIIFVFTKQGNTLQCIRKIDITHIDIGIFQSQYKHTENSISFILEDKEGQVWIGTQTGLYVMNREGEINYVPGTTKRITSISESKNGNIWVSSSDNGIICIQKDSGFKSYNTSNEKINSDNIQSIYCQASGLIWAGSKKGVLYLYDELEDCFIDYQSRISNEPDPILDITEDGNGHLWVSMNKKIMEINPETLNTYTYTPEDGFIVNSFNKGAFYKDKNGQMMFGGNNGFFIIKNSVFSRPIKNNNRLLITNVNLQENSIFNTPYKDNLNLKEASLLLLPDQNNIEINFSAFNYFAESKTEYAYKMEGIDPAWNYAANNRNFAIYNNLPKGKYTFSVKSKNEYGIWNDSATTLTIHKKPYFYETWLAYLIYIITIVGAAFYLYRSSLNRLKLKNELRIAQIEKDTAEQLVQTKLQYFTNISHELMTPLTIISCLIEEVRNNSSENNWEFQTMLSNLNRLKRLLQQILDFRKVESGNMKLRVQWGDIVSFAKHICENNFTPLIRQKKIQFSFSSSQDKIELYYDADKMDKILYNLLSNAIKYTPEGGAVNVSIDLIEGASKSVRLIVSDTGRGINPEELPNIFKRFYTSGANKKEYTNGIGLSLTKELIELHHGTISVESQPDAGTIFIIQIPVDPGKYTDDDFYSEPVSPSNEIILSAAATEPDTEVNSNEKADMTLLIVEDNPELRFVLNKMLSRHYNTLVAENGKQALEITNEKDVDVIISDVAMPEMDGLTLCRKIKENIETSHIPVLLITARNTVEDRVECYEAGADGYLSKPFEQQVFNAKLKSLIKNRKAKYETFRSNVEMDVSNLDYPSKEQKFLNDIIELIQNEFLADDAFDPDTLAERLNISRSSLYRKIKSLTDLSPSDFIRNIRLKQACVLLKDKNTSIKEVAYAVGFVNQHHFSSRFKNEFGMTPSEYQKKYSS